MKAFYHYNFDPHDRPVRGRRMKKQMHRSIRSWMIYQKQLRGDHRSHLVCWHLVRLIKQLVL